MNQIADIIRDHAIDYFGIMNVPLLPEDQVRFDQWIASGSYGSMEYLCRHTRTKLSPESLLSGVHSMIIVGMNYYREPLDGDFNVTSGRIARYAHGRDYHKVLGNKLKSLVREFQTRFPGESFYFNTDATPLLERAYAREARLGFIGKNTMVISPKYGSWFVIGEILTTLELAEMPATELTLGQCGTCRRCQDICPTGALDTAYSIDANKCISYLTIEHRGSIPVELRPKIGNWLFGCDLCQEVCPHNARAKVTQEPDFVKRIAGDTRELREILEIKTDDEFLQKFAGSPLMRAKREGLVRNACIVAANIGARELLPILSILAHDKNAVIAEHAEWALSDLAGKL